MKFHSTYYGISIYRNTEPGYKLRWFSETIPDLQIVGRFTADTLDGIRSLIRYYVTNAPPYLIHRQ